MKSLFGLMLWFDPIWVPIKKDLFDLVSAQSKTLGPCLNFCSYLIWTWSWKHQSQALQVTMIKLPYGNFWEFWRQKVSKILAKIFQILSILTSKSPGRKILTSKFTRFARILAKKAKNFSFRSVTRILPEILYGR